MINAESVESPRHFMHHRGNGSIARENFDPHSILNQRSPAVFAGWERFNSFGVDIDWAGYPA
jgi:hypothetical protein